jgi:hypothetical protein
LASRYQIGTQAVAVEVFFAAGKRLSGEIFLRLGAVGSAETVSERMNDGALFFPFREPAGQVILIGKSTVLYVVTPSMDDDDRVADERSSAPQVLVTAELDSGEAITGVFFVDLPPGQVRTLDYINDPKRAFVPLAQLDREYLINRARILHLRDVREDVRE